jgi:hypothetical protein
MLRKVITYITYPALIAGLVLCLVGVAYAATNIDSTNKWAWGTNIGWINFNPTHGGGVTVYDDHLEGYVWAENIGWIRLGTTGSGSPYYDNTSATDYGVNNDGSGNLSGYAWSTNAGWINFNPGHSQVTINTSTGKFDGYAWGENVGWIHFQNASPEYYVKTDYYPTVVTLARFVARSVGGGDGFDLPLALVALGAVGLALASSAALTVALVRRRRG